MSAGVRRGPFVPQGWDLLASHLQLSPRQAQIGYCLFQGMSDKRIAGEVGIKISTVRTHLERLFRKVNTQDRFEFVQTAMRQFCTGICPMQH